MDGVEMALMSQGFPKARWVYAEEVGGRARTYSARLFRGFSVTIQNQFEFKCKPKSLGISISQN